MKTLCDISRAKRLFDEKEYEKALEIYLEIYQIALDSGTETSFLLYQIALCFNDSHQIMEAATYINKALALDPFNLSVELLAMTIYDNIMVDIDHYLYKADKRDNVMELYNFCLINGRVTSNLEYMMVKHHLHFNETTKAKYLIDNALARNPYDKEYLVLRKNIAVEENDTEKLEELETKTKTKEFNNPRLKMLS
ncbi:MAG: hypothetical protein CME62_05970 [Halobacteriovoraceae bacterium]|nr:hypothetical protein [Halobacteriovoraceae bacterium]|tara:strand:- start:1171 stop:1755 length:585 start_codon:yes stop_codon:yes gene_type:complete